MRMNLYQKTTYEVYQAREHLGYKIFDFDNMFAILWNEQKLYYCNMIHADKFGKEELKTIKEKFPNTFFGVASAHEADNLEKGNASYLLVLNVADKFKEDQDFEILKVTNEKTAADFADVIAEVYHKEKDRDLWLKSFKEEIALDNCFRYVGYIDGKPAGTVEFSEGKEAVSVCWGAVKEVYRGKGLYKAMLYFAINNEFDRGFNKIVLNSSEMGRAIYLKMGFVPLADRFNYVVD